MKKVILLIILCLVFAGVIFPLEDAISNFEKGNRAYREGKWAKASEFYRDAATAGLNNSTLWYNLGCSAWKSGSVGSAILYFERAAKMNPRDPDIKNNLEFVRAHLPEKPQPREGFSYFILSFMTLNELLVLVLVLLWIFFILLGLYFRLRKEPLAWIAGVLFIILLILSITSGLIIYNEIKSPQAVILPEKVEVYSGPGRDYTGCGNLSEGSIVRILRTQGDWCEIGFRDRFKGWIRKEEAEKI
ncbi:MAG: tetratricopeptide repeat protein [Candidatus Eremiobacteraeota bacterium]|nr:tetratricopeptide repeat protein [Candidatus Eremiobacteraeota bacterium]